MSFYTCFGWFKKLRLFVNERNLKIDVTLKASHAVVIRCFFFNEPPKFIFRLFALFWKKINKKKFELIYKDWSKLFVRFIRNNLNQVVHTLVYNLIEVISSWTEQKMRSILKCITSHFSVLVEYIWTVWTDVTQY